MTTTTIGEPTGRAIRNASGYGAYHAEVAYRDDAGEITVHRHACRTPILWAGEQEHPRGWAGAVLEQCAPCRECMALVPVPEASYGHHHRPVGQTRGDLDLTPVIRTRWSNRAVDRDWDGRTGQHRAPEAVSA